MQLGARFRHSPAGLIVQDELAAAGNQHGQNAAQAQEVTRLQRQVADLQAEIVTQAGIVRQSQQSRRELTQQHEAAQAGMLSHASPYRKYCSMRYSTMHIFSCRRAWQLMQ